MKKFRNYNLRLAAYMLLLSLFVVACSDDDPIDPTGDFTYVVSSENPMIVSFEATATDGITLAWDFGDGGASIAAKPEHTYAAGGTYEVTVTIFGEEGSTPAVITKTITVVQNPTAAFSYEITGLDVMFTSTTTATVSVSWDFGDGTTSTDANPTHTYADYGDYTVSLTATGAEGSVPAIVTKTVSVAEVVKVFEPVTVENADFELPGDAKHTNWTDVPGWNSDTEASDSGVEGGAGAWTAFIKNTDPAVYNLTDHLIEAGEEFKITLNAWDIWNGPKIIVTLYYNNGDGTRNELGTQTFDIASGETLAVEMTATATEASVGARLGIELSNVSGDGTPGWTGFDDVSLFAK